MTKLTHCCVQKRYLLKSNKYCHIYKKVGHLIYKLQNWIHKKAVAFEKELTKESLYQKGPDQI